MPSAFASHCRLQIADCRLKSDRKRFQSAICNLQSAILLAFLMACNSATAGEDWPGWRGPTGMGQSDESDLPLEWGGPKNKNVLWKVPLFDSDKIRRDQNQSSPIVWGERVFVTTSFWPEGISQKKSPNITSPAFTRTKARSYGTARFLPVRGC
jgi:hypothetical protein